MSTHNYMLVLFNMDITQFTQKHNDISITRRCEASIIACDNFRWPSTMVMVKVHRNTCFSNISKLFMFTIRVFVKFLWNFLFSKYTNADTNSSKTRRASQKNSSCLAKYSNRKTQIAFCIKSHFKWWWLFYIIQKKFKPTRTHLQPATYRNNTTHTHTHRYMHNDHQFIILLYINICNQPFCSNRRITTMESKVYFP